MEIELLKSIGEKLHTLRNSCYEGRSGVWDTSTEEGREGFDAMADQCEEIAKLLSIELEPYLPNTYTHIRIMRYANPPAFHGPKPGVTYYEIDAYGEEGYSDQCWNLYDGKLIDEKTARRIVPEFCDEIRRPDLVDDVRFV